MAVYYNQDVVIMKITLVLTELLAHKLPKARNLLDKSKGKPTGHKNAAVKQPHGNSTCKHFILVAAIRRDI